MNATVPDITSFLHYAQARANALTTLLPDAWQARANLIALTIIMLLGLTSTISILKKAAMLLLVLGIAYLIIAYGPGTG